jgi:mannose-6-phosphate isomerase-like protein (cupin superfamily)
MGSNENSESASHVIALTDAVDNLHGPGAPKFIELYARGTLSIELYTPRDIDTQQPHDRDEVYVVIAGHGEFVHAGKRSSIEVGDLLFVAAGVEHRFENFSPDLAVWVVFYGPEGGELPGSAA